MSNVRMPRPPWNALRPVSREVVMADKFGLVQNTDGNTAFVFTKSPTAFKPRKAFLVTVEEVEPC